MRETEEFQNDIQVNIEESQYFIEIRVFLYRNTAGEQLLSFAIILVEDADVVEPIAIVSPSLCGEAILRKVQHENR